MSSTQTNKISRTDIRRLIAAAVLFCSVALVYSCSSGPDSAPADQPPAVTEPTPAPYAEGLATSADTDYSEFKHTNETHSQMPCLLCHTRDDNAPEPKFSGHIPCSSCHVQQFADSSHQICAVCHTDTASGALKRFPPLRNFNAKFDHGRHLRQTNCATCHKPLRAGVALSLPSGVSAHATCFQCHSPGSTSGDRDISSCSVCHEPGRPVRGSTSAKAFKFGFSHREHAGRRGLDCSSCHTVLAGQPRGRQVRSPVTAMHAAGREQGCASCHNDKRAFGDANFTNCKRCHEGPTFQF